MLDMMESMRKEEQREKEKQEMSKKKVIEEIERIKDFENYLQVVQVPLILIVVLSSPPPSPLQKKKNISKDRVCMELSMNDVLDMWVPFLTKYKVSVRAKTSLLASLFKIGGVDLNTVSVSKSSPHKNKKILIENEAGMVREENLNKV